MHPIILAIETATEACSAALLTNDEVFVRFEHAPRQHTQKILPMLDAVLEEANLTLNDVDAIAFGCGPGAFTGLRIATGIAQGLALSVDIPLIPVSTLAAMAQHAVHQLETKESQTSIVPALDARMQEVYWGEYQINTDVAPFLVSLVGKEQLGSPEKMLEGLSDNDLKVTIGSGWDVYEGELFKGDSPEFINPIKDVLPSAEYIARLALPMFEQGRVVSVEEAQPVYIRNEVAEKQNPRI